MARPANLISDSSLVQETFELVNSLGGRATFREITNSIFHLSNVTDELAASLVSDLIQNDVRFSIAETHLAIASDGCEDRLLRNLDFVVLDVEAVSGRSVSTRMIELGACHVAAGSVAAEFETLLNPDLPLPPFITTLTGITQEMIGGAPRFADIAESWLNFAGDAVLVAHNSDFDLTLLNHEIARVFPGSRMRNADLCTVRLARRILPALENHHLDALADHFGFQVLQRHRAIGDARATAKILLRLLDELETHGVRTLAEAREFHVESARVNSV